MSAFTLKLTTREASTLAEAVRYAQQTAHEGGGRHDATLSRIQRKLGETVGCGDGDEPF